MGKKKIIAKQEKPVKQEKQQKVVDKSEKKPKKSSNQQQNLQIFTPEFYSKLNDFQNFYKEVLQIKSDVNKSDLSEQFKTANDQVRKDLQTASAKILREQLVGLQKWIESQQNRLRAEIQTVQNCYTENQKALQSTKAFSVDEITSQLSPIQLKINEKQASLDNYGELLARSRGIYGQQSNLPNNDNDNDIDMNLE